MNGRGAEIITNDKYREIINTERDHWCWRKQNSVQKRKAQDTTEHLRTRNTELNKHPAATRGGGNGPVWKRATPQFHLLRRINKS